MSRRSQDSLIEDLKLIRDVRKGTRRQSENPMRTASFAKEDRKPINRIKLIEVVKVPMSRDDNVYRNN